MRALLVAVLLAMTVRGAAASDFDPALVDAARKDGTVVWYTGLIVNQIARPLAEAFEARFPGLKVLYTRASNTDTTVKLLNEGRARRIQADVVDLTSGIHPLVDARLMGEYRPKEAAAYPDVLKDKNGLWVATNLYFLTVAYNTNLVKPEAAPKTFTDLLAPELKGRMAWTAELAVQGPPGFIHNVLSVMGQDKGMDYLRRFAAQQPVALAVSPRAVLDQVISGEYAVGIQMYNHHVAISAGAGAPIAWAKLEPLPAIFNIMGVLKDAPHPNAARLFESWVLSDEGQKVMAANDYLPASPAVPARIPELKPDAGKFAVNYISPDLMRDELGKWTAVYHEVFR